MRVLIADDEPHLALDLQRRLERLWPELDIVAVVHDGVAARDNLIRLIPDVAFLDIRMPGISGLEAARSAPQGCRIIFVTAFDDQAVSAFELAAVDYLLKPVADERLARCVLRLRQSTLMSNATMLARLQEVMPDVLSKSVPADQHLRWLRVQDGRDLRLLPVDEVCYFQSADKYTTVVTASQEYLLRTPLKDLTVQLHPEEFWQIHRGTVVRVAEISAARRRSSGRVVLHLHKRSETLPVSRRYSHLFRQM